LRHKYVAGPYPNDFATWAAIQVRDRVLEEKLAILEPYDFENLEVLRAEIVTTIEEHLSNCRSFPERSMASPSISCNLESLKSPTSLQART